MSGTHRWGLPDGEHRRRRAAERLRDRHLSAVCRGVARADPPAGAAAELLGEPHGADGPDRLLAVLPRVAPPTPPTPPSAPRPAAKPSLYRRARRKAGKLVKKLTGRTVRWPGLRRR